MPTLSGCIYHIKDIYISQSPVNVKLNSNAHEIVVFGKNYPVRYMDGPTCFASIARSYDASALQGYFRKNRVLPFCDKH